VPPFLVVQLSDLHIGADWGGRDPVDALWRTVEAVGRLRPAPDAVVASGDLTEHAADEEYALVREMLAALEAPLHVLPGNHDDRAALRVHFGLPGEGAEPVQYAAELGPVRLVVVDSTRPGAEHGELDAARLAWLDAELAAAPGRPTIVAMHHPPLLTGVPAMDAIGVAAADRRALGAVVERHPHVRRIVAGHVHRAVTGVLGGCPVLAAPSTFAQLRLDFTTDELVITGEPSGYAVHALVDGELVSHVRAVG
jgi:3',5'-cyclic AMP phosphodiesterase CpdA